MHRLSFFASLLLFLNLSNLRADVVELENGDRLTGTVKSLSAGVLGLTTDYAGELKLDWSKVVSLTTSDAFQITTTADPEPVQGKIVPSGPGRIRVESEPPREIDLRELATLQSPPLPDEEPALWQNWHGGADIGYSLTRGNTDLNNLGVTFQSERKTKNDRTTGRFHSLYAVQEGINISNLYRGSLRFDRFLVADRVFVFLLGGLEKDERQLLDLRTRQGGGVGLSLNPFESTQLSIFGGATFLQERYEGADHNYSAEALAGLDLTTEALAPFILSTRTQLTPILTEDRYLLDWDAHVRLPLFSRFSLGLQLFNYFDSSPQPGVENTDSGLLSSFGVTF